MTSCKICGYVPEVRKEIEDGYHAMVAYRDICANINRKYQLNLNASNISHHRGHETAPPTEPFRSNASQSDTIDKVDISQVPKPNAFEIVENALKRLLAIEKERGFLTAEEIRERTTLLGFHISLNPEQRSDGTVMIDWQTFHDNFKLDIFKVDQYPKILAGEPEIGPKAKRILVMWSKDSGIWLDVPPTEWKRAEDAKVAP